MKAYYNEFDPYAAQWLRNLIGAGLIAQGDVDERSIVDVRAEDLSGYMQCHFFAGIGGWSLALRLAGWPDDKPVWTGSCPCQPFSVAGKLGGFQDERHLWPEFKRLIAQRRPATVFGEQVANAVDWLRIVRNDLEALDYAVGCVPLEAASADAEHFRDRYWFVADHDFQQSSEGRLQPSRELGGSSRDSENSNRPVAYGDNSKRRAGKSARNNAGGKKAGRLESDGDIEECRSRAMADADGAGLERRKRGSEQKRSAERAARSSGSAFSHGLVVHDPRIGWGEGWTEDEFRRRGFAAAVASVHGRQYIECPDGKWRGLPPPGVRWLGNGIPARVDKLRAIGNAIDPRPASEFIKAFSGVNQT